MKFDFIKTYEYIALLDENYLFYIQVSKIKIIGNIFWFFTKIVYIILTRRV